MKHKRKDVNKVPNLRFPGFEGQWKNTNLRKIAKFSKGKGISKNDIEENGEIECVRYGELYTHYGEVISEIKSKTNVDKMNLIFSEANDVIIPASGETQIDIATAACVLRSGVALGGDLNIIKTSNNGVFLSYYLNSKRKIEIARLAQGVSVVHLYSSQLASLDISYPTLAEQNKVASFLSLTDERISTQNKIIEHLQSLKNGLSKKLLTQELKFKNNDFSKWKETKLSEITTKSSSNISANTIEENFGKFKIYGAAGLLKKIDFYREKESYISIIKDGAGVGRTLLCEGYSSVIGTLDIIKPKKNINLYFIYCLLDNISFLKYITGSTIPHIYFKDYSKEKIQLPCLDEQTHIANFISSIALKIEVEKQLLSQYKDQKKYLSQNLFI